MSSDDTAENTVETTVELTGEYEDIASILGNEEDSIAELDPLAADLEAILDIVGRTGGATKSHVVEELPSDVTADVDTDAVIHMLRVLELYDLVVLDGNTWRPGPALPSE
jgi:hypothetical protein